MSETTPRKVHVLDNEAELAEMTGGAAPQSTQQMGGVFGEIRVFAADTVPSLAVHAGATAEWNTLLVEIPIKGKEVYVRAMTAGEAAALVEARSDLYDRMWNGCGCRKPNYAQW